MPRLKIKRQIQKKLTFNIVVEGTESDDWKTLNYKVANIPYGVEEDAVLISDGVYRYGLYGKTEDFKTVKRQKPEEVGELEIKLEDFLGFSPGVVLPFRGGAAVNILGRPRAICTRDGRVFIDDGMMKDREYLKVLPKIVESAKEIFESEQIATIYRAVMNK